MPEQEPQTVAKLRKEFAAHIAKTPGERFQASPGASALVSKTIRNLERKRQTGELTLAEQAILRKVDDLLENISKYNQGLRSAGAETSELSYDYKKSELKPDPAADEIPPVVIPSISDQQADQIISGLTKQFEEKVLKKIEKHPPPMPGKQKLDDSYTSSIEPGQGRSLQDFLVTMKREPPEVPFQDEDSKIDISKLARNVRPGKEN